MAGLVDSIKKHKKFKQLASYSIQCIEKVICPPRIGWEANARAAFELGAAEDIADVCARFATDAEVFTLSISSLNGIGSVPRAGGALTSAAVAGPIVLAVAAYFSSVDCGAAGAAEALTRLSPAMDLLVMLARYDAGAFAAAGGVDMLLRVVSSPPPAAVVAAAAAASLPGGALTRTPSKAGGVGKAGAPGSGGGGGAWSGASSSVAIAYSALVASCTTILERASRVKHGLDALTPPDNVAHLLTVATLNLNPPEAPRSKWDSLRGSLKRAGTGLSGGGTPSSTRRSLASVALAARGNGGGGGAEGAASPGGRDSNSSGGGAGSGGRDLNAHLDPAFRILDRIARGDAGRDLLLAQGATQRLSGIMVRGAYHYGY